MNAHLTWRHWTVAGLAALYLLGLGFLGGMTAERFRFDAERTMILARLTLATMQAKQRLMLLELDHPPEAGQSEQDFRRPLAT